LVKKSIFLRMFDLPRPAFQQPCHLPKLLTLKLLTI
jgi:hypothetical protein